MLGNHNPFGGSLGQALGGPGINDQFVNQYELERQIQGKRLQAMYGQLKQQGATPPAEPPTNPVLLLTGEDE